MSLTEKKEKFMKEAEDLETRVSMAALKWKTIGFSTSKTEYFYVDCNKNENEGSQNREIEIVHSDVMNQD